MIFSHLVKLRRRCKFTRNVVFARKKVILEIGHYCLAYSNIPTSSIRAPQVKRSIVCSREKRRQTLMKCFSIVPAHKFYFVLGFGVFSFFDVCFALIWFVVCVCLCLLLPFLPLLLPQFSVRSVIIRCHPPQPRFLYNILLQMRPLVTLMTL